VQLDAVEAGGDGILRGRRVVADPRLDLVSSQRSGSALLVQADIARADDLNSLGGGDLGVDVAAESPELAENVAAFGVDNVCDLLPVVNLSLVVNSWGVGVATVFGGDKSTLSDQ
jgi:hypothetical protein